MNQFNVNAGYELTSFLDLKDNKKFLLIFQAETFLKITSSVSHLFEIILGPSRIKQKIYLNIQGIYV